MFRNVLIGAAAAIVAAAPATSLAAIVSIPLSFTQIGGDPPNVASQLSVLVTNANASGTELTNQVRFRFTNAVGVTSSVVTAGFFRASDSVTTVLGGSPSVADSGSDVNFSSAVGPFPALNDHLAGTQLIAARATDTPPTGNGLDQATDWLDFTFTLSSGDINTVLGELSQNKLLIYMKVQGAGTDTEGSSQYINLRPTFTPGIVIVPLPPAMLAGLAMLGGLGLIRTRRTRREG